MSNWESGISTNRFDICSILGGCHVICHFPNSTSNGSRFMHYDLHHVTSFSSDFYQAGEELRPALMDMAGLHCLDMTNENDQIYLCIPNSHHDPISWIRNPPSQRSRVFQNTHHEFYDPISKLLEQYYSASHVAGNKLYSFLALAKKNGAEDHKLIRGLWGLLKNGSHWRGKHVCWVVVTHISTHRQDLLSHVCQVFVFSVALYFLSVLIACIFLVAGHIHLLWLR